MAIREVTVSQRVWSVEVRPADSTITTVYPDSRRVDVVFIGTQGPTGPPGATLPPIAFAYNNASPRVVYTPTVNVLVVSATILISAPFNGASPTLQLGTALTPSLLVGIADNAPTMAAEFENDCFEQLNAGTDIILTINPDGSSQGNGLIILETVAI